LRQPIAGLARSTFLCLIALKKEADRDQDRIDIEKLRKLYPEYEG